MSIYADDRDESVISVVGSPKKARFFAGKSVHLWCSGYFGQQFQMEWRFYGLLLPRNARMMDPMHLVIDNIEVSNSGIYSCMVSYEYQHTSGYRHTSGFVELNVVGRYFSYLCDIYVVRSVPISCFAIFQSTLPHMTISTISFSIIV